MNSIKLIIVYFKPESKYSRNYFYVLLLIICLIIKIIIIIIQISANLRIETFIMIMITTIYLNFILRLEY
jgi:hypothetical protein